MRNISFPLLKEMILITQYCRGNILIDQNLENLLQKHLPMLIVIHIQETPRSYSTKYLLDKGWSSIYLKIFLIITMINVLFGDMIKEITQKYVNVQNGISGMMSGALIETEAGRTDGVKRCVDIFIKVMNQENGLLKKHFPDFSI